MAAGRQAAVCRTFGEVYVSGLVRGDNTQTIVALEITVTRARPLKPGDGIVIVPLCCLLDIEKGEGVIRARELRTRSLAETVARIVAEDGVTR